MDISPNAKIDFLSGCYAKEALGPSLDRIRAESQVQKTPFSVVLADLDHFKAYNDKYGHLDGDQVLKYFSSTLRLSLDPADSMVIRFGGDEFVILFENKTSAQATSVMQFVKKNLKRRPFLLKGKIFNMTMSVGVASFPADGNEAKEILDKADKAMYFSKTHGRNQINQFCHMKLRRNLERVFLAMLLIALAAAIVTPFIHPSIKAKISGYAQDLLSGTPMGSDQQEATGPDTVRLKNGRVLQGTILKDTGDEVYFRFTLGTGEGIIRIKKVNIKSMQQGKVQ